MSQTPSFPKPSLDFPNIDYTSVQSLPELWAIASKTFGSTLALHDPHSTPEVLISYRQLYQSIHQFAAGLQSIGVKANEKIALFADNSPRWFIADQGIMTAGAANVVRSGQAERQELLYIYGDSDSTYLIVENLKTLNKLRPELDDLPINSVIVLSDEAINLDEPLRVLNFQQLMERGENATLHLVPQTLDTLATLLYTSGTTGKPKGVMLAHGNFLHQMSGAKKVIRPDVGDRALSILPSWHAYERTVEYYLLSQGCAQIYTNIRYFKQDLKTHKPNYMVGVPRLWESIYEGVQKQFREQPPTKQRLVNFFLNCSQTYVVAKRIANELSLEHRHPSSSQRLRARAKSVLLAPLHALGELIVYKKVRAATGGQIKCLISGGGSLARHLDTFYEIVNVPLLVGYGLTETSPITNVRRPERNLRGSSGPPLPLTEIRIVEPTTRQTLPQGEQGLVLIRGPQVMQGYYKKPEATAKAIDPEGWFDSGDLGWVTQKKDLVLTGRAKDTIVLSNGENIEPQPIEDACVRSPFIDQIMVVGQDQKSIGALIVPNLDALQQWAREKNLGLQIPIEGETERKDLDDGAIQKLFREEIKREVQNRPGYRSDDRIADFRTILEPFTIENGLMTQTLKIRRPVVRDRYRGIIDEIFEKNR
ncbi:long-chain fatty acid--CoA ligase [Lusitaniella coriacea LEGE 07157]|uniref:Long-chain fatty acid--CoA ligase n=1 Tax=Lusitaniella coriacea LEGE 07157 TaxID=945747 RepID=A0A8J7DWE3_9CYAN|nr:long-chain fatty acid--CoA ligase [Lusitaniella coriacea]MBE9116422.1 long-chain fatty acid--CoA ligase [Lusitaniella coriacea LEGE 07157]